MRELAVAHVVSQHAGGIGRLLESLLPELGPKGARATLFVREIPDASSEGLRGRGVDVRHLVGTSELAGALRDYDLVHYHSLNLDLFRAGESSGKPIVYTLHGLRATAAGQQTGRLRLPRPSSVLRRLRRARFQRFLSRSVDLAVAPSRFLAGELETLYGVPASRVRVISNGIDVKHFAREPRAEVDGPVAIGFVGRLAGVKRVDLLLRAFAEVREAAQACVLEVVGEGPLRPELERLADSLGIASATVFTGHVGDPASRIAAMDVFALCSEREGSSLALMEALASGVPCVVMQDGGGAVELVVDSRGGLVADGVDGLASVLLGLVEDAGLRESLGVAGRAFAQREFDIVTCAERHVAAYREVLGGRRIRESSA